MRVLVKKLETRDTRTGLLKRRPVLVFSSFKKISETLRLAYRMVISPPR